MIHPEFKAKLDSGLYGGIMGGVAVGIILGLTYWSLDPDRVPLGKAMTEITLAMVGTFGFLGVLCQVVSLYFIHLARTRGKSIFLWNEITGGIGAGILVGAVIGPLLGWYFGRYAAERPFAPPSLILSSAIPGGVLTGVSILLYDKRKLSAVVIRNLVLLVLISMIVGTLGFALIDRWHLEERFYDLMYGPGMASGHFFGGAIYAITMTVLLGLHIGLGLSCGRIWEDGSSPATSLTLPAEEEVDGEVFDIAISVAGEDRALAKELADLLRQRGIRVYYDDYDEDAWGSNLYEYLSHIYRSATFCVMFLSRHYAASRWTTHERRSAQERAFLEQREYILPLRIDDTDIPGIPRTIGYLDLRKKSIGEVADRLVRKLARKKRKAALGTSRSATR